jgi:drug/metabolite transporter (DMT)-like permease
MTPILHAVLAAVTFGLSAPLAKLLLGGLSPLMLAGLLYLGAALFLSALRLAGAWPIGRGRPLRRQDGPALAATVAAGGFLAPPLLLWGLAQGAATTTALLLNLEAPFTVLLAGAIFGEHLGWRVIAAGGVMALGGMALSWTPGGLDLSAGALAVAGACALWALDSNLTRLLADVDAVRLVQLKGLTAGTANVALAVLAGQAAGTPRGILLGLALGAISYGSSLVFYILALRALGAARTAGYFALAPFVGAAAAVVLVDEPIGRSLVSGSVLMAIGTGLLLRERHWHGHAHDPGRHGHLHVHDAHHQHDHEGGEGPEPHEHAHGTGPLRHGHSHIHDRHHGHPHR